VRAPSGLAVAAERIAVGDNLSFRDFEAEGQVMLLGGRVDGQLLFSKARLANPGFYALYASAVTVGDSLYLWEGFTADGEVVLRRTQVRGGVHVGASGSINLDASAIRADSFHLRVENKAASSVFLRQANVRQIGGDPGHWPSRVNLDGLAYETLNPHLPAAQWLEWLRRHEGGYAPQPYEQLSAACRRLGLDSDARHVLLAKQRVRRKSVKRSARLWGYLRDWAVGYGYLPGRGVAWLLTLLIIGTIVFSISPPSPLHGGEAPHFNPFFYTFDLLLPIISYGQQPAWNPIGVNQWLAYLLITAGWLLATSVAAGITRVLTRN
jgi:hypothetical protein